MLCGAMLPLRTQRGIPNELYDLRKEHSSGCFGSFSGCAHYRRHLDYWGWNLLQTEPNEQRGKLGFEVIDWHLAVQLGLLVAHRLPFRHRFLLGASAGFTLKKLLRPGQFQCHAEPVGNEFSRSTMDVEIFGTRAKGAESSKSNR
jgi:hypothetical protein